MNERIQELITQSRGYWNHGDFNMPKSVEFQEQDIEKFAELIVRECAEVADDGFASSNFGNGITGQQLLKHFGIE